MDFLNFLTSQNTWTYFLCYSQLWTFIFFAAHSCGLFFKSCGVFLSKYDDRIFTNLNIFLKTRGILFCRELTAVEFYFSKAVDFYYLSATLDFYFPRVAEVFIFSGILFPQSSGTFLFSTLWTYFHKASGLLFSVAAELLSFSLCGV